MNLACGIASTTLALTVASAHATPQAPIVTSQTLTATLHITDTASPDKAPRLVAITLQKPNAARIRVLDAKTSALRADVAVSEGVLTTLRDRGEGQPPSIRRETLPSPHALAQNARFLPAGSSHPAAIALGAVPDIPEDIALLLLGVDPLARWKQQGRLLLVKPQPDATLDKETVRRTEILLADDPQQSGTSSLAAPATRILWSTSTKTGLLKQATYRRQGQGIEARTVTVTVRTLDTSPRFTQDQFVVSVPPGAIDAQGNPIPASRASTSRLTDSPGFRSPLPTGFTPGTAPVPARGALGSQSHDFGQVSFLDSPTAEHRFTLTNTTGAPLTLQPPRPSCACIAGRFIGATPSADGTLSLAAGASVQVAATLTFTGLRSGPLVKEVLLTRAYPKSGNRLLRLSPADAPGSVYDQRDRIAQLGVASRDAKPGELS
jgi:hypothetical protein